MQEMDLNVKLMYIALMELHTFSFSRTKPEAKREGKKGLGN